MIISDTILTWVVLKNVYHISLNTVLIPGMIEKFRNSNSECLASIKEACIILCWTDYSCKSLSWE